MERILPGTGCTGWRLIAATPHLPPKRVRGIWDLSLICSPGAALLPVRKVPSKLEKRTHQNEKTIPSSVSINDGDLARWASERRPSTRSGTAIGGLRDGQQSRARATLAGASTFKRICFSLWLANRLLFVEEPVLFVLLGGDVMALVCRTLIPFRSRGLIC